MAQNIIKQRLDKDGSIIEGSETVAGNHFVVVVVVMKSSRSTVVGTKSDNETELQETVEVLLPDN